MVIFSFSTRIIYFTLIRGYYNEEESRHNPINVTGAAVAACEATRGDTREVSSVAK